MNFIGLDIHKKTISYCVKGAAGEVLAEGMISSTRQRKSPKSLSEFSVPLLPNTRPGQRT
jgi:hypothetical protein